MELARRVRRSHLGRIPGGQINLFNVGTNSNIGTSRVQFVLGFSSRRELKATNTRSIYPLAIRARTLNSTHPGMLIEGQPILSRTTYY